MSANITECAIMESEGLVPQERRERMGIDKEGARWRTESSQSAVNTAAAGV